jgi:hypothetical protein
MKTKRKIKTTPGKASKLSRTPLIANSNHQVNGETVTRLSSPVNRFLELVAIAIRQLLFPQPTPRKLGSRTATLKLPARAISSLFRKPKQSGKKYSRTAGNSWSPLFGDILTSTIWQEDDSTRLVWIAMLAMKDANGKVSASVPGLAHVARVSIEDTRKALKTLESPDPESRTKEHEGRRIEKIDGGWIILNHFKHRQKLQRAKSICPNGNSANGTHTEIRTSTATKTGSRADNRTGVNADSDTDRENGPIGQVSPGDLSQEERRVYDSLATERLREAFLIIRDFAERAADIGEPDFPVAQSHLAKRLNCKRQNIGAILFKLQEHKAIAQTRATVPHSAAARYRWALESTLPIPTMEEETLEL